MFYKLAQYLAIQYTFRKYLHDENHKALYKEGGEKKEPATEETSQLCQAA